MRPFNIDTRFNVEIVDNSNFETSPYSYNLYNEDGDLKNPKRKFPIRKGLELGDTVLVIKGNDVFTGVVKGIATTQVHIKSYFLYKRYERIVLYLNNKEKAINRMIYFRGESCDIEVYYSKVVLTEKWVKPEMYDNI